MSAPDKSALRNELLSARASLSPADRPHMEARIRDKLLALPAWRDATHILGYIPTRGELDTLPLWAAAVAAGKTFALPVTESGAREGRMSFRTLPGFCPDRLAPGRYGILEPPREQDFPALSPAPGDRLLLLVPGLGFDGEGFRLGYGGGYYDRFLASLPVDTAVTTVGLCPAVCRRPALPREPHDRAVDVVIDELN